MLSDIKGVCVLLSRESKQKKKYPKPLMEVIPVKMQGALLLENSYHVVILPRNGEGDGN